MNETTQSALLYAKFRSSAAPLKIVVSEIEQRSHDHEEYASLLNECYQAYFGIRIRLITPIIITRAAELSGTRDIIPYVLARPNFANLVSYGIFFPSGSLC